MSDSPLITSDKPGLIQQLLSTPDQPGVTILDSKRYRDTDRKKFVSNSADVHFMINDSPNTLYAVKRQAIRDSKNLHDKAYRELRIFQQLNKLHLSNKCHNFVVLVEWFKGQASSPGRLPVPASETEPLGGSSPAKITSKVEVKRLELDSDVETQAHSHAQETKNNKEGKYGLILSDSLDYDSDNGSSSISASNSSSDFPSSPSRKYSSRRLSVPAASTAGHPRRAESKRRITQSGADFRISKWNSTSSSTSSTSSTSSATKTKNGSISSSSYCGLCLYYVLEYAGPSLASIKELPLSEFRSYLFQTLYGLYVARTMFEFVHSDLHAKNILIQEFPSSVKSLVCKLNGKSYYIRDRLVKITDFGLSRIRLENGEVLYNPKQPLTSLFGACQWDDLESVFFSFSKVRISNLHSQSKSTLSHLSSLRRAGSSGTVPLTTLLDHDFFVPLLSRPIDFLPSEALVSSFDTPENNGIGIPTHSLEYPLPPKPSVASGRSLRNHPSSIDVPGTPLQPTRLDFQSPSPSWTVKSFDHKISKHGVKSPPEISNDENANVNVHSVSARASTPPSKNLTKTPRRRQSRRLSTLSSLRIGIGSKESDDLSSDSSLTSSLQNMDVNPSSSGILSPSTASSARKKKQQI